MIKFIKKNIKFILIYISILIILTIKFPYYVQSPGGIIDISDRISIENSYKSSGSFNLSFVSEYNGTLINLFLSLFDKDSKIKEKKDVIPEDINVKDYEYSQKISLEESYSNAIYLGYTKSGNEVKVKNEKIYVDSILEEADTNLRVGDQILEVDNIKISSKEEITNLLNEHKTGDKITIKIIRNDKEEIKEATLIEYEDNPIIGITVAKIKEMDTNPKIKINYKARESGPSGGLMLSLAIYNSLVSDDITKGMTIVGTGTIDEYGNVGSIGGVEYKLAGAVKNKADIFLVPAGENYEDAMKLKKERHYKIKIKGVKTFDEALEYLLSI